MFMNDKPHGQGKREFIRGNEVYDGMWVNGKATGQGVYYYSDGVSVYRGEFYDMKPQSFGQMTTKHTKYIGEFKAGNYDGMGRLENSEKCTRYVGMLKENKRHGQGFFMDQKNALLFEGFWKDDMRHGQGKQTNFAANQTIMGVWQDDQIMFVQSYGQMLRETLENAKAISPHDLSNSSDAFIPQKTPPNATPPNETTMGGSGSKLLQMMQKHNQRNQIAAPVDED